MTCRVSDPIRRTQSRCISAPYGRSTLVVSSRHSLAFGHHIVDPDIPTRPLCCLESWTRRRYYTAFWNAIPSFLEASSDLES